MHNKLPYSDSRLMGGPRLTTHLFVSGIYYKFYYSAVKFSNQIGQKVLINIL